MTWKKFWKRVNALIYDNCTVLCEGEDIEDWEEVQRKQRKEEAERQQKEQEILATLFLRKEYINEVGSNVSFFASNSLSVIRAERAICHSYRLILLPRWLDA